MTGFAAWGVVATEKSFEARELPYSMLSAPFVIALHPSRGDAEQAMNRAILVREAAEAEYAAVIDRERSERAKAEPGSSGWTASIAHELAILNKIAMVVHEVAQPRKGAKT